MLCSAIDEAQLLKLDVGLLCLGFSVLLVTTRPLPLKLLSQYFLNSSFFVSCLYLLAPICHTLTRSISSDTIWAITGVLIFVHLFLHGYSGSTIRLPSAVNKPDLASNISLNASIVASVLVASRLPSRYHVFAIVLFFPQIFLFPPFITLCIKNCSFRLHVSFSLALVIMTLYVTYLLHHLFFILLLGVLIFVSVVCPYWLIRIQEYKFEIKGPWDEAKLCFDITELVSVTDASERIILNSTC